MKIIDELPQKLVDRNKEYIIIEYDKNEWKSATEIRDFTKEFFSLFNHIIRYSENALAVGLNEDDTYKLVLFSMLCHYFNLDNVILRGIRLKDKK